MINQSLKHRLAGASILVAASLLAACESKEDKAAKFAASGLEYMEEGNLDEAEIQFNNALFQDENNIIALRGAAEIADQQKEYQRQAQMLTRLLDVEPQDIEANNNYARLLMLSGDADRAREHVDRVLNQDPENVSALTTKGALLVLDNKVEDAEDVLKRALVNDSDNPEIFNLLAATSLRNEDPDAAIARINEGIEKADNPETLLIVKLVLAEKYLGEDEVLETFRQLIEVAPESGTYREKFAEYHLRKTKDYDAARTMLQDALPYLTEKTDVLTRIVTIDRMQKGNTAAETTLKRFISENPEDVDLRFSLPRFYCETEQNERCRTAYRALADDESLEEDIRFRALNGLSDVAMAEGNYDEARKAADDILDVDAKNSGALVTKGQLLLVEEKGDEAVELLRAALDADPGNTEGQVYLALAYEQADQIQFADAQFARAVDEAGFRKSVVDQYRAFLTRQGETDRAIDLLERYVRANPSDIDAVYQNAEAAIFEGRFVEAEQVAQRLAAIEGFETRSLSLMARALSGQDRYADALPYAEQLTIAAPENRSALRLWVNILSKLDREEEGIQKVQEWASGDNPQAIDFALLADLYRYKLEPQKALDSVEEGLAAFPADQMLYVVGYLANVDMDNREAAAAVLKRGIENAPNTVELRTVLSNELITTGNRAEAINVLESLYEDDSLSPLTANNLASLLLDRGGANERALEIARRFEGTTNAYFADTLAWAYYKNDQLQNAARYSRVASEQLVTNSDVLYHRGVIEAKLGNATTARDFLDRAKSNHTDGTQTPMSYIEDALASL